MVNSITKERSFGYDRRREIVQSTRSGERDGERWGANCINTTGYRTDDVDKQFENARFGGREPAFSRLA